MQVVLTNLLTHEKVILDTVAEEKEEEEGFTILAYKMWSPPNQVNSPAAQ